MLHKISFEAIQLNLKVKPA